MFIYKRFKLIFLKYLNYFKRSLTHNISSCSFVARNVQILGLDNIIIKEYTTIGENTVFTVNNRTNTIKQMEIKSNCYIGRDNFFSVGKSIVVRDYCIFGNKCSLICSDHIFADPLVPYAQSGNSYNKRIYVGTNCWFGHDVMVLGNVKIGHGSIIGAKSLITKDIPPFSMVVGNPAKIIKTYNFTSKSWEKGDTINESIFNDEETYLYHLQKENKKLDIAFHSASSEFGDI